MRITCYKICRDGVNLNIRFSSRLNAEMYAKLTYGDCVVFKSWYNEKEN